MTGREHDGGPDTQRDVTVIPTVSCSSFPWACRRRRSDVVNTLISPTCIVLTFPRADS